MSDIYFRLEVWRPARFSNRLMYVQNDGDDGQKASFEQEQLHEQIYSWGAEGNVWSALGIDQKGQEVKERIASDFKVDLLPSDRGFDKISKILDLLKEYLDQDENRSWETWEQALEDDEGEPFQTQPILAFYHHLRWLYHMFQDLPGASVTIR